MGAVKMPMIDRMIKNDDRATPAVSIGMPTMPVSAQNTAEVVIAGQVNSTHSTAADLPNDLVAAIENNTFFERL